MGKVGKIAKGVAITLVITILLSIVAMAVIWFAGLRKYYKPPQELAAVREYSQSEQLISKDVYDQLNSNPETAEYYALGVNKNGDVVFLNPKKAWKKAKKEYREGRKAGDHALHLKHSSKTLYMPYIEAAKTCDSNDELTDLQKKRLHDWANFLEIYKNSFPENARR